MPTFRVFGAPKQTGAEMFEDVSTASDAEARAIAAETMYVSSVRQLSGFAGRAPCVNPGRKAAEPLADLLVAASVAWWLAMLGYLVASVFFLGGVATIARAEGFSGSLTMLFLPTVCALGIAALLQAVSGICKAVRLIAISLDGEGKKK